MLVYVFNFDLLEFSSAILEKGLLGSPAGPQGFALKNTEGESRSGPVA